MSARRTPLSRRVVTMAPSPWHRRKRLRLSVAMGNATDMLVVLVVAALLILTCFEAQSRKSSEPSPLTSAHERTGGSMTAVPEAAPPPKRP